MELYCWFVDQRCADSKLSSENTKRFCFVWCRPIVFFAERYYVTLRLLSVCL